MPKSKKNKKYSGNKGTQGKVCWEQWNTDSPGRPSNLVSEEGVLLLHPGWDAVLSKGVPSPLNMAFC